MVKGGRKAQVKYWKHYRQIHRDRDRLRKARKGIRYSRVVILGVKVQLPPLPPLRDQQSADDISVLPVSAGGTHRIPEN